MGEPVVFGSEAILTLPDPNLFSPDDVYRHESLTFQKGVNLAVAQPHIVQLPWDAIAVSIGPNSEIDRYVLKPAGVGYPDRGGALAVTIDRPVISPLSAGFIQIASVPWTSGNVCEARVDLLFWKKIPSMFPTGSLGPHRYVAYATSIGTSETAVHFSDDIGSRPNQQASSLVPTFGKNRVRLAYDLVYGTSGSADITVRMTGYVFSGDRYAGASAYPDISESVYSRSFTGNGQEIQILDVTRYDAVKVTAQATSVAATSGTTFTVNLESWA